MKGKKKWLIGATVVIAALQALATAGVVPPVIARGALLLGDVLLPPGEQAATEDKSSVS